MRSIDRDELAALKDRGAQVVDVLPADDYGADHLPGAVNIPLRELDKRAPVELDRARPVVVYCWDVACDLSPRAARRLEGLGFSTVYDYTAGKLDWLAAGLPTEGTNNERPRAGVVARRDVVTCSDDEQLGAVRARAEAAGQDTCVVVDDDRVVVGLLRPADLASQPERPVKAVMHLGPSTFRPHEDIAELAHYFTEHNLSSAPITTSGGQLVGLLGRQEAVAAANGSDATR